MTWDELTLIRSVSVNVQWSLSEVIGVTGVGCKHKLLRSMKGHFKKMVTSVYRKREQKQLTDLAVRE